MTARWTTAWTFGWLSMSHLHSAFSFEPVRTNPGHIYEKGERVQLVASKLGPLYNPSEKYRYYDMPFCTKSAPEEGAQAPTTNIPDGGLSYSQGLGEDIKGLPLQTTPYQISFMEDFEHRVLCNKTLMPADIGRFARGIKDSFFFEMFVEDMPLWGYLGDILVDCSISGGAECYSVVYLYTQLNFELGYNGNRVVSARVTTDMDRRVKLQDLSKSMSVQFTYAVHWTEETNVNWSDRMSRYKESRFIPASGDIHWMSVVGSGVMALALCAVLACIFRKIISADIITGKETSPEASTGECGGESGWRLLHADVFRFPQRNKMIFCAAIGAGNHLMAASFLFMLIYAAGFVSVTQRGSVECGAMLAYWLTSPVGGYSAVRFFLEMAGEPKKTIRCALLTATLFPIPLFFVFTVTNLVAISCDSSNVISARAIAKIFMLHMAFGIIPSLLGWKVAQKWNNSSFTPPTPISETPRDIPRRDRACLFKIFRFGVSALVPFSAIYIESYYAFASVWGHQLYAYASIGLIMIVMLAIISSLVAVFFTYMQLAREDHQWFWPSLINGGIIGLVVFLYSVYYCIGLSGMNGALQLSFFFGYNAIIALALFLMMGSAGFQCSFQFVKFMYSRVKFEQEDQPLVTEATEEEA